MLDDVRALLRAGTATSAWPGPTLGYRVQQSPFEWGHFCDLLREHTCRSYLEIGLYTGGHWTLLTERLGFERTCGISLPDNRLLRQPFHGELFLGDSASAAAVAFAQARAPFDCILIDGDHHHDAVLRDWQNYGPLGKLVAFHDIYGARNCDGSRTSWEVLKSKAEVVAEFIDLEWPVGIGVVKGGV